MAGSITLTCGHQIKSFEDAVDVTYMSWGCDAVDGYQKVEVHATVCRGCEMRYRSYDIGGE